MYSVNSRRNSYLIQENRFGDLKRKTDHPWKIDLLINRENNRKKNSKENLLMEK